MAALTVASFLSPRLEPLYRATARTAARALDREAELVAVTRLEDLAEGAVDAAFLCGLPYVELRELGGDTVEALAAPVPSGVRYGDAARYFSDVVVRDHDAARCLRELDGRRWAYNERRSHSGYNVMLASVEGSTGGPAIEADAVCTGSHEASLAAVREGAADFAAIDSHLFEVLRSGNPAASAGLKVIESLGPSPSQPLAAGPALGPAERRAIAGAVASMATQTPGLAGARVERWAEVDDAYYDAVRAIRRVVRGRVRP